MPERPATTLQLHPRPRAGAAIATTTAELRQLLAEPLNRRRRRRGLAQAEATPTLAGDDLDASTAPPRGNPIGDPPGGAPSRAPGNALGGIERTSTAAAPPWAPGERAEPSGMGYAEPAGTGRSSRAQRPTLRPPAGADPAPASASDRAPAPSPAGATRSMAEPPAAEHRAQVGQRPTRPVDAHAVGLTPAVSGGRAGADARQASDAFTDQGPAPTHQGQRQDPQTLALDEPAIAAPLAGPVRTDSADRQAPAGPDQPPRGIDTLAAQVGAGLRRRQRRVLGLTGVETAEPEVVRSAGHPHRLGAGPARHQTPDASMSATLFSPFSRAPLPELAHPARQDTPRSLAFADDDHLFQAPPDELGLLRDQLLALLRREAELHGIHLWER